MGWHGEAGHDCAPLCEGGDGASCACRRAAQVGCTDVRASLSEVHPIRGPGSSLRRRVRGAVAGAAGLAVGGVQVRSPRPVDWLGQGAAVRAPESDCQQHPHAGAVRARRGAQLGVVRDGGQPAALERGLGGDRSGIRWSWRRPSWTRAGSRAPCTRRGTGSTWDARAASRAATGNTPTRTGSSRTCTSIP